jgi:hypothetical protein
MRSFRLPLRFEERVTLSRQFCLQPLFPLLTGDGEFFLLSLSQKAPRLFRGSRFQFEEVALKNVPAGLTEVTAHVERQRVAQVRGGLYYGLGDAGQIKRNALIDYFRQVNRGVREALGSERAPLVLAGVESQFPLYREVNTYPHLADQGVGGNPGDLSLEDLHQLGWEIVAPLFRREQREAAATYERLAGTGRTAGAIAAILPAAHHGRVESLFVPVGRPAWGRFEPDTGAVALTEGPEPGSEDLLNLAAIYTYRNKGAVYAVHPDQVPGNERAAAVLRY